jgi:hypothetical protein
MPINPSPALADACDRFLADIRAWVRHCITGYDALPVSNVHDQATYTTSWEPYIRATQDEVALDFMIRWRDKIRDHYVASNQWRHGYWRMQEAHHGTEHYELFLGSLLRLRPDDAETGRQLVDAAEHMGNWAADVPPWFDWQTRLFKSLFFGSDGLRTEPGMDLNTPDHLRCANICLLAQQASGEDRFLELATTYAGHWAEAILAQDAIPIGLTVAGPLYALEGEAATIYRGFAGEAPDLTAAVDRAENLLTSDAVQTFLTLWQQTGQSQFRAAAEKLLDLLTTQLTDPDAGVAAAAVRAYRQVTGDQRYDQVVLTAVAKFDPTGIKTIGFDPDVPRPPKRESGLGKRSDMPHWLENGQPRRHNPLTLALAAEITADTALATQAIDLARAYFNLARHHFPDGRDHGCAARTVSAIARGHGRDNHAGMITAVLGPLWHCFLADH